MLINKYIKMYSLELVRNKSAAFFTIVFPALLLIMFGRQGNTTIIGQWDMFVSMSNYAVQSSMFLALGMSIAMSRGSKWNEYMQLLPVSSFCRVTGKVIAMFMFAVISLLLVIVVGMSWLHITIHFKNIAWMFLSALVGGIPLGFLGVFVAYLVNEVTARSVFVVLNLLLFFAAFSLPDHGVLSYVRYAIPTYQWLSLSCSLTLAKPIEYASLYGFIGYTVLFYFMALRVARSSVK